MILYSCDPFNDFWEYDDITDAIMDSFDVSHNLLDKEITVYEGELKILNPIDCLPYLPDYIGERMGDVIGYDASEEFVSKLTNLQSAFKDWFADYMKTQNNISDIGEIVNIKPVKVKITNVTEYDFDYIIIDD